MGAGDAALLVVCTVAIVLVVTLRVTQWRRAQRRKRARKGRCLHCGYVLHGVRGVTCPEFGRNTQPENAENQRLMQAWGGSGGGWPPVPPHAAGLEFLL